MRIRRAKPKDAEQIAKIYLQFWEVHSDKNPLHQPNWKINYKNVLKDTKDMIKSKEYLLYVAEEGQEILGFVLFTIKNCESWYKIRKYGIVEEAAVDKKYRRKGIARKLVEFALDYFRKKGCKYAKIAVEVNLPVALSAWESLGFKQQTIELVKRIE